MWRKEFLVPLNQMEVELPNIISKSHIPDVLFHLGGTIGVRAEGVGFKG